MPATVTQYGFFFDQSRCVGCQDCAIACKSWNMLPAGPVKWLRLFQWEEGAFPGVRVNTLFAPCYHCENPVCIPAANGALYKEPKYGAVLIDPDKATSAGLKAAWDTCPYGAIAFDSDAPNSTASKCTMCIDRLEQGMLPVCVNACPMRALDFGPLTQLRSKYGTASTLAGMPNSTSSPAVVFKAKDTRTAIVPYDSTRALQLFAQRPGGLPPVYSAASNVTDIPAGLVTRGQLNMHPRSTQELMHLTRDSNS